MDSSAHNDKLPQDSGRQHGSEVNEPEERPRSGRASGRLIAVFAAALFVLVVVVYVVWPFSSTSMTKDEPLVPDSNVAANSPLAEGGGADGAAAADIEKTDEPRTADEFRRLAATHAEQGEWEEAAAAWRQVIAQQPHDPDARMGLGQALERLRKPKLAWLQYEETVRLDDSRVEAHQRIAHLSAAIKQWAHAARHFRKVADSLPNDHRPRFNLGLVLAKDDKWRNAAEQFREVLEINPESPHAKRYLQQADQVLKRYEGIRQAAHDSGQSLGPVEKLHGGFVGSDACRDCHQRNYETWHATYHRTMTQEASSDIAMTSFNEVDLHYLGVDYRLHELEGELWVETLSQAESPSKLPTQADATPGEDEQSTWRKVAVTTGSHHAQAYWLTTGKGRALEMFPLVFIRHEQRWVPFVVNFLVPPSMPGEPEIGQWNYICSRCHTTQARPRKLEDGHPDTHVSEFGISCEACHGPGERHLEIAESGQDDLAIVDPSKLTPMRSTQVCGQCHSSSAHKSQERAHHWLQHGFAFRPGDDFEEFRDIVRTGEAQFWNDEMVRVSGREYNGLLQTPCHTHGDAAKQMTCVSCHQLHQSEDDSRPLEAWANDLLKPEMDSNYPGPQNNQACTQCHEEYLDAEILATHTHHEVTSSGSQCYNCHMPHTTWGVRKAMRSHTISSPSVKESLSPIDRPNACNLCHVDQTLAWTAEHLSSQYGHAVPELTEEQKTTSATVLWALRGDAGQRALAAWTLGWQPAQEASGTDWLPPFVLQLMGDPYDIVRVAAYRSLKTLDGYEGVKYDYVAPVRSRQHATARLLEAWKGRADPQPVGPRVLIDDRGQLLMDEFKRLFEQRDHRPVQLLE